MSLDLSAMVDSLDAASIVLILLALGQVWLAVAFVSWAVREVGDFFDDVSVFRGNGSVEEWAERFGSGGARTQVVSRVAGFLDRRRG